MAFMAASGVSTAARRDTRPEADISARAASTLRLAGTFDAGPGFCSWFLPEWVILSGLARFQHAERNQQHGDVVTPSLVSLNDRPAS